MSSLEAKVVRLLDFTSGRDALYKSATGFLQALTAVCVAAPGMERSCVYHQMANALMHARAVLRVGTMVEPVHKIVSISKLYAAQGWTYTEGKKCVELLRAVLRLLFRLGDAALLVHYYTTPYLAKAASSSSSSSLGGGGGEQTLFHLRGGVRLARLWWALRVIQVASAVMSAVLAHCEWRDGRRRLRYDPPAAHAAIRRATNSLVRDLLDVAVNVLLCTGGCNFNHEDRDNCVYNGNVYYSPDDEGNTRLLAVGLCTGLAGLFTCRVLWNEKVISLVA